MKIEVPENMSVVRQSLLTGKTSVIKGRSAIRIMPWQLHLLVSLDGLRFTIQHEGLLTGDIVRSSATTTVVLRVNSD
ncbi:MAG: hypothetical protein ABIG71_04230, partial [Candidatus Uhrbacteria bacterium]